jgi:hypothetical protein
VNFSHISKFGILRCDRYSLLGEANLCAHGLVTNGAVVVTARVQTDVVQSLRHQHRDLYQSTYPYLSEDRDSSYYQVVSDFGFSVRYTCVSFSLFPAFIPRSTEKAKKIHIFRCPITLRTSNFVSVTLLSLCPSWLSLVAS